MYFAITYKKPVFKSIISSKFLVSCFATLNASCVKCKSNHRLCLPISTPSSSITVKCFKPLTLLNSFLPSRVFIFLHLIEIRIILSPAFDNTNAGFSFTTSTALFAVSTTSFAINFYHPFS